MSSTATTCSVLNATNGAIKLAEQLGVDLLKVIPMRHWIGVDDVHRYAQAAQPTSTTSDLMSPSTPLIGQPKKRRRVKAAEPAGEERPHAGGDPMLVDGNHVRVTWPLVDGTSSDFTGVVRWLPQRAVLGRKRVYEITFDDGDVRMTQLLGKVPFVVTESGYKAGRFWTESESSVLARISRNERPASVAVSLGRSRSAITTRHTQIFNPAYAALSGVKGGRNDRVGWRGLLAKAMLSLPEQQGTLREIYSAMEMLPGLVGKLDSSVQTGSKSLCRWQHRVISTLSVARNREFERIVHSNQSQQSVYRYNARNVPSLVSKNKQKEKKQKEKKMLDYIKAFRK
ncbi:hypothetical protein CYMTET_25501 [Cymbomonas tetramitiformis]|uniref:Uncharacterized protein n=1 Tax=Cymbomonas tetramitiformis TaxID=36881 RepID=A0AAE0KYV3_9CHLO|nr:hypothetical protein CYMTET_25501 [Cymbomonas tetramitiformis]|eukprot:gene763-1236_t